VIGPVLAWFGPDSDRAIGLREAGVVREAGDALRDRFLDRVAPLLEPAGIDPSMEAAGEGSFDEARRRTRAGGPDEQTVRRIRGDHNRAFLMD
jgi:hypothetical protein